MGAGGSALSLGVIVALMLTLSPSSGGADTVIAADGGPGEGASIEKPTPRTADDLDPDADADNAAVLAEVFGKDFKLADEVAEATLRPGSPSAEGLPSGYGAGVSLSASVATERALPQYCTSRVEKGSVLDGCVDRELSDGETVHENWGRWGSTEENPQTTTGESVRVLFQRMDDVLVWADLVVSGPAADSTVADLKAARKWLESFRDKLGALVTDPDIKANSFIQADGDPKPTLAVPTLSKAEKLCRDGGDRTTAFDLVLSGNEPTDPETALEQWVSSHRKADKSNDLRTFKYYRVVGKTPAHAYAHYGADGRVDFVVEFAKVGKGYVPIAETNCR